MRWNRSQVAGSKTEIKAAVYARYSSEMQSSSSARDQIERAKAMAAAGQIDNQVDPGAKVSISSDWVFSDEAVSGKVAGRRGYQAILAGIRQRAFDLLIVDDLSRLTRSLGNLLELYQLLRHHDVELVSISDRVSSADPNARTFFTVKGMVADFGNEAHSERTIRGLEARARESFSTGKKPYGYESEATRVEKRKGKEVRSHFRLFIDKPKAAVVRRIFETFVAGYGKKHIAKSLNADGIPSPSGIRGGWKPGTVYNILQQEKYSGRWTFNKVTWSVDPDTGRKIEKARPAHQWVSQVREDLRIITESVWDAAQAIFRKNEQERAAARPGTERRVFGAADRQDNKHLLSGLLSCAACGGVMVLVSGRREGYYGCFDAYNRGNCSVRSLVSRKKAERSFVQFLRETVSDEHIIDIATSRYNEIVKSYLRTAPSRKSELEVSLRELTRQIDNMVKFIVDGKAGDSETLREELRNREAESSKIKAEIMRLGAEPEKRLLVTPHLVRSSLQRVAERIATRGPNYNRLLKDFLSGPISVTKGPAGAFLEGELDLGRTLGASQFNMASPTLNCPHPDYSQVLKRYKITIA